MCHNPEPKALETWCKNTKLAGCCHHQNAKQAFWHIFFRKKCVDACKKEKRLYLCRALEKSSAVKRYSPRRPVRLGVRTQDFHSCNTGSIPVRATM